VSFYYDICKNLPVYNCV